MILFPVWKPAERGICDVHCDGNKAPVRPGSFVPRCVNVSSFCFRAIYFDKCIKKEEAENARSNVRDVIAM